MKRKRKRKNRPVHRVNIRIFPRLTTKHPLPRIAVVDWGNGTSQEYRMDHLSVDDLEYFWKLSDQDKLSFFKKNFNKHHRKPRCQKGPTEKENLSNVDIVSHDKYNFLIYTVARWARLPVEKVKTPHIAKFLACLYPSIERLAVDQDTGKLKSFEEFKETLNEIWLPKDEPINSLR